ncbi:MAG: DUF6789 family protein [Alphaproteobacteria bacterium]
MRTNIAITDRIGNGIVAGFIATFVVSVLHEPVALVTAAVGMHAPVGLLFHFFVGTLLWGGAFGLVHDWLVGPSWLRGMLFGAAAALVVMFGVAPLTGSGFLCLKLGVWAPIVVVFFHLSYGAILGLVYAKLVDTDEARFAGHVQH